METLQYFNTITTGQIIAAITTACAIIGFFAWKLTRLYFDISTYFQKRQMEQTAELKRYLSELTQAQTRQIEDCIHKTPGHPENKS